MSKTPVLLPQSAPSLEDLLAARMIAGLSRVEKISPRPPLRVFVDGAWKVLEPNTKFIPNWSIDAICEHLEAVSTGEILRLMINIAPRCMKSFLVSICWPAWEWIDSPWLRSLYASHDASLGIELSLKCRRLIESEWYQENW